MALPNQNIPESKKDKKWMERCGSAIVQMSFINKVAKTKDRFCYDMYNGVQNETDYDYLRKVGDYEYPSKIRFVPLIRPKLDLLRAEETKRPFNWKVYTVDSKSINDKTEAKMQMVSTKMATNQLQIQQALDAAIMQMEEVEMQIMQIQQNAQESGEQIPPELVAQFRLIQNDINTGKYVINHQNSLTKENINEIENYFKYSYQDFLEIIAEKGIKYLIATGNLKEMFNRGFEDKMITDKEYYYCDWDENMNSDDPVVRKVNPLNFYYAGDSEIDWVGESEWCMEERYMTINQIVDEFGNDLSFSDMEKIKKKSEYMNSEQSAYGIGGYYGNSLGYNNGDVNGCNSDGLYSGSLEFANVVRVCTCFWKSPRKIRFKKSPNKYKEDSFFTHVIGEDEKVNKAKKEREESGYLNDLYTITVIDTNIYIKGHKKDVIRSQDNYSKVEHPFVGKAHNFITKKPYSLVWASKDIQILYNLIHYHKELWISLSGVKGFIMDKSQIPEGMSMKEWMYQRKLGVGWIQSVRSGLNRQPSFNQFQNFDDSISPSIQYLMLILQHLEELASSVTGVSRQRMGMVAPTDQVGSNEQSIMQSNMVTEILFHDHEQVKRRVINRCINLCRKAWKKGKQGSYILGDLSQEILDISENELDRADFKVFTTDSGKEQKTLNDLKSMAFQEHAKGVLTFSNLVKVYNVDSIHELESLVDRYEKAAEQRANMNQQEQNNHEKEMLQMENELKVMLDKQSEESKMFLAQIEQAKLEFEKQKFGVENQRKTYEADLKSRTDLQESQIDASVELEYLEQQKVESNRDFALSKAELAMQGVEATEKMIESNRQHKQKIKD